MCSSQCSATVSVSYCGVRSRRRVSSTLPLVSFRRVRGRNFKEKGKRKEEVLNEEGGICVLPRLFLTSFYLDDFTCKLMEMAKQVDVTGRPTAAPPGDFLTVMGAINALSTGLDKKMDGLENGLDKKMKEVNTDIRNDLKSRQK